MAELSFRAILYNGRKKHLINLNKEEGNYFSLDGCSLGGKPANVLCLKRQKISFGINNNKLPNTGIIAIIRTKKSEFHDIPMGAIGVTVNSILIPNSSGGRDYQYKVVWEFN